MKYRVYIKTLFIFAVAVFVVGCNTAQKALERGDFEKSADMTISKLRSKPGDKKARRVFQQAWPMALEWHQEAIAEKKRSTDPFKWDEISRSYATLDRLSAEVRRCPACLELVERPRSYENEIREANQNAAEAHYQAGLDLMKNPTRENARNASYHFREADYRVSGYRDSHERLQDALEVATLKVMVEHLPLNLRRYELSNDYFRDQIYNSLENGRPLNEFVRFYTAEEVYDADIDDIDQVVRLEFVDFTVGRAVRNADTKEIFSKDSVKVGEVKDADGKKLPVYGIVKARYTTYKKTVESGGELELRIIDNHTGRLLSSERIGSTYVWADTWASFNGDERALTTEQLRLAKRNEIPPPADQELFVEFTKPLYTGVIDRLRRFYK